jgi:uncharacterized protein (TIGR03437 family)
MASPKALLALTTCIAGLALPAAAQTFDTSGNGKLNGPFFLRQVITTSLNTNTSAIGRAVSLTGVISFDGQGNYTFIGSMMDNTAGNSAVTYSATGTYLVESNGMAQIQNPIDANDTEYGGVSGVGPVSVVASSTEGNYNDVFVAIQAGSGATNGSITGSYSAGFIDFLQANASQVRDGFFNFTSAGTGNLGNLNVNGAMANQGSNPITQAVSGVTYSINTSNGAGVLTFPTSSTPLTALVSGQKTLYVSADGSMLLGGDPNGFDLIIGIKSVSGAANSMYQGTYYNAALENDASDVANGNNDIDSYYGSTLALGAQGTTISHERLVYFDEAAYDYTTDGAYNFASDGSYSDSYFQYQLGVGGKAALIVGTGTFYSLSVNVAAQPTQATSVFIDPLSIFNAASYAPITNSVAPGEFVSIFGSGLASGTAGATTLPLPKTLGTTSVTVNGRAAPLIYASSTQINLLVPFATSEGFATFQVTNNNVQSNKVTVYNNLTAPGIFTLTNVDGTYPAGVGPAAVLHLDYSLVTQENPAQAGETLLLFLTGLGAVTPPVADGAAAPSSPLANVNEFTDKNIFIDIFDAESKDSDATVSFAGLAPGFAGLYQINFTVPSGVASGLAYVNISTVEAYSFQAKLFMK